MPTELYRVYRPKQFEDVAGQPEAVKMLAGMVAKNRVPHALMLTGPSGVGKTTLARILRRKLGCHSSDFTELNCADVRGIDAVRDVQRAAGLAPMGGKCRMWLLDESAKLTNDAQTMLLKVLEDTPAHAYFVLATTDPQKHLKTILNRCTEIRLRPLPADNLRQLVGKVAEEEAIELVPEVLDKLVEVADGSARKALVLLQQIAQLPEDREQLDTLERADTKRQAIEIARALLDPRSKWDKVAAVLRDLDDDPESVRHLILAYAQSVVLGGGQMAGQAGKMLTFFESNFFDSKKPGLVGRCWEMFQDTKRG